MAVLTEWQSNNFTKVKKKKKKGFIEESWGKKLLLIKYNYT